MANKIIERDVNVRGRLIKLFRNCPKPDGWFGGVINTVDGPVGITGSCDVPVVIGMTLIAVVDVYANDDYGLQYKAKSVSVCMDDDRSLIAYLCSNRFQGIGQRTAEKIVFQYGKDTLMQISEHPDDVKRDCHVTDKQMESLIAGVNSYTRANRLFAKYPHLTDKWSRRLVGEVNALDSKFYDPEDDPFRRKYVTFEDISKKIDENPYCLVDEGVPFSIVDAVALYDCKWSWDNQVRVDYVFMLEMTKFMNRTGGTYINLMNQDDTNALRESFAKTLLNNAYDSRVSDIFVKDVMVRLSRNMDLCFDTSIMSEHHLYVSTMRQIEQGIVSECMHHLTGGNWGVLFDKKSESILTNVKLYFAKQRKRGLFSLSKEQENAVYFMIKHSLSCLKGGPGRGKTFVMKALAEAWSCVTHGEVVMLAPTGKAVARLKESTGWEEVQTISRCMLMQGIHSRSVSAETLDKYICDSDGGYTIHKCPNTLLIVDESSMIDFSEGFRILNLFHDCHIVFVGDSSQLPPIEPGAFFRELIVSDGVPVFELVENHRTESLEISENADRVLNGDAKMDITNNFSLMPCDDESGVQYILDMYQQHLAQGAEFSDILLMSPVNKGVGSVTDINTRLQDLMNPQVQNVQAVYDKYRRGRYYDTRGWVIPGVEHHGLKFRIGDRVMNMKNHAGEDWCKYRYDNPDDKKTDRGCGYFNGDTGIILRYYFSDGRHEDSYVMVLLDDKRLVEIDISDFHEWVFAYCITVHKSQGCEAKYCMLMLPSKLGGPWYANSRFLNQNLLYTAITRAKTSYTVVGNMTAFKSCVQTPYAYHNTALSTYINNKALPYLVQQTL